MKSPFKLKSPFKGLGLRKRKSGEGGEGGSPNREWMAAAADRFFAEKGGEASVPGADAEAEAEEDQLQEQEQPQAALSSASSAAAAAAAPAVASKPGAAGGAASGGSPVSVWGGAKGLLLLGAATLAAFLLAYRAALSGEEGR